MSRTSPLLRSLLAGGAALATAERKRRKKMCKDNHWLHRPSPLPMLISPSSEVEEHLKPTLTQ